VGCCSTRAQVRFAAPVVFPLDFDGGEHVSRVHPINVKLVTDQVIMPSKEEHEQWKMSRGSCLSRLSETESHPCSSLDGIITWSVTNLTFMG
jgi:hypothetical protein